MAEKILEAIQKRVLLGDGAMGTQLQYAGLEPGGCGEAWNVDHPDRLLRHEPEVSAPAAPAATSWQC